jgi:hypothetical protein
LDGSTPSVGDTIAINLGEGDGTRCYIINGGVQTTEENTSLFVVTNYGSSNCFDCTQSYICPSPTPTPTVTPSITPTNAEIALKLYPCAGGEPVYGNFALFGVPSVGTYYIEGTNGTRGCFEYLGDEAGEGATFLVQSLSTSYEDCTACAEGPPVSPTATPSKTPTSSIAPTITPTRTKTPTVTRSITPTKTKTPTPTPSPCTTQIVIDWSIMTCSRGTFNIYVNGSNVYSKNALAIAGSGVDTITVPYGATINLQGSAQYIASGPCPIGYESSISMTPVGGGANGVTIVKRSETDDPPTFSYTYTKTCPTTTIYLVYETQPI